MSQNGEKVIISTADQHLFCYLIKSRFVNEMFTASTNTGLGCVILKNGICTLRLVTKILIP